MLAPVPAQAASIHRYRAPAQLESTQRSVDAVQLQHSSSPYNGAFANSSHIGTSSQLPRGNHSTWRQHLPCCVGKRQFLRSSTRPCTRQQRSSSAPALLGGAFRGGITASVPLHHGNSGDLSKFGPVAADFATNHRFKQVVASTVPSLRCRSA